LIPGALNVEFGWSNDGMMRFSNTDPPADFSDDSERGRTSRALNEKPAASYLFFGDEKMATNSPPGAVFETFGGDIRLGTDGNYWLKCRSCTSGNWFKITRLTERPEFPAMPPGPPSYEKFVANPNGTLYFNIQFELVDEDQEPHDMKTVCDPRKWNKLIDENAIPCAIYLMGFPMFYMWETVYADPQTGMVWLTGKYHQLARQKRTIRKSFDGLRSMMHLYYENYEDYWTYGLVTDVFPKRLAKHEFVLTPLRGTLILKEAEYIDSRDTNVNFGARL
jgi:hypothetical protein